MCSLKKAFFLQLGKKRHVGNDVLCVVFTDELTTTFSPLWIKSQFLYAYILVQVMSTTLDPLRFKVQYIINQIRYCVDCLDSICL